VRVHWALAAAGRRSRGAALAGRRSVAVLAGSATARLPARCGPALSAGTGGVLTVVAHPDDDLFFISPDLVHDVRGGRAVTTVYVTSGDAGRGDRYRRRRERGVAAAYAQMAGVPDVWTRTRVRVAERTLGSATLAGAAGVRLYFLRLPDGGMDGRGTARSGSASLEQLWERRARRLWTVELPAQAYSRRTLVDVLGSLMVAHRPVAVRTLDHVGSFGDGDHSDHHAVARLAVEARDRSVPGVPITGYVGYPVAALDANVLGADLDAKAAALAAYAPHDPEMCRTPEEWRQRPEGLWLARQHVVAGAGG
jgi:LmbE family N-acetylglucosaminyl deacetylase